MIWALPGVSPLRPAGHRRLLEGARLVLRPGPRTGTGHSLPGLADRRGGASQIHQLGFHRRLPAGLRAAIEIPLPDRQETFLSCLPLNSAEVEEVIAAGRDYFSCDRGRGRVCRDGRHGELLQGLVQLVARGAQALGQCAGTVEPRETSFRRCSKCWKYGPLRQLRCLRSTGLPRAAGRCGGPQLSALAQKFRPVAAEPRLRRLPSARPGRTAMPASPRPSP